MVTINVIDQDQKIITGLFINSRAGKWMLKHIIKGLLYSIYGEHGEYYDEWSRLNLPAAYDETLIEFRFQAR